VIAEIEREWNLGWGGFAHQDEDTQTGLLGWWWAHTNQEELAAAEAKGKAPQPPRHRVVDGRRGYGR